MPWNWELPQWPNFRYDPDSLVHKERQLLLTAGKALALLKSIDTRSHDQFIVEILSREGQESALIEGEILNRESLQSSIRQQFGLAQSKKKGGNREANMAGILCDVYQTFDQPLSREMLSHWHKQLFSGETHIGDIGHYRTHPEPMQIISHRYGSPRIFFEAPPSSRMDYEMALFIKWFNSGRTGSILARAAIAHLYFENIHPFEDGNGRIGRLLIEKVLSQGMGSPVLIAVSRVLEKWKKKYYTALGLCNRTLEAQQWVEFLADAILCAQSESTKLLYFLIQKTKMLTALGSRLNPRQEKVLLRMFAEGLDGFKGGLSAENYISIANTSRATATRDLNDLMALGALEKTGELRHTRYRLNIPDSEKN